MLGLREKEIYGEKTYKDLVSFIKTAAGNKNLKDRKIYICVELLDLQDIDRRPRFCLRDLQS